MGAFPIGVANALPARFDLRRQLMGDLPWVSVRRWVIAPNGAQVSSVTWGDPDGEATG